MGFLDKFNKEKLKEDLGKVKEAGADAYEDFKEKQKERRERRQELKEIEKEAELEERKKLAKKKGKKKARKKSSMFGGGDLFDDGDDGLGMDDESSWDHDLDLDEKL